MSYEGGSVVCTLAVVVMLSKMSATPGTLLLICCSQKIEMLTGHNMLNARGDGTLISAIEMSAAQVLNSLEFQDFY